MKKYILLLALVISTASVAQAAGVGEMRSPTENKAIHCAELDKAIEAATSQGQTAPDAKATEAK